MMNSWTQVRATPVDDCELPDRARKVNVAKGLTMQQVAISAPAGGTA